MRILTLGLLANLLSAACANVDGPAASLPDVGTPEAGSQTTCTSDALSGGEAGAFADAFVEPQYAMKSRTPELGATVCNVVLHGWKFAASGTPPSLYWAVGPRHDAGKLPTGPYSYITSDGKSFKLNKTVKWPGPGSHVHMVALDSNQKLILDPLFEYDLAPTE